MSIDRSVLERTLTAATRKLLDARVPEGHWEGYLSSSALSTATSLCALQLLLDTDRGNDWLDRALVQNLVDKAAAWLANHQNEDGGWGDTADSPTNISTTTLCWAALGASESLQENHASTVGRATSWLEGEAGDLTPLNLSSTITDRYGNDRSFSVPILTMCALAGRFGSGREAWRRIPALPFELAACPHQLFHWLGLPVVSYALPALIAIGQARHYHRPTRNPITRILRYLTREKTLDVMRSILPDSGGFLEAAPITGFVLMSMVSIGRADHPVAKKNAAFLIDTARDDGSWPIDTNLATWVTALSVGALSGDGRLREHVDEGGRSKILSWLLDQQYKVEHPYTHSAPGGWAWTDLTGGVPDADDTSGTLLAIRNLVGKDDAGEVDDDGLRLRAANGVRWLIDLQNKDGGMPTFCRGWGKLPFDRSTPDLTAHALRAWQSWKGEIPEALRLRVDRATSRGIRFLINTQTEDGAWAPLWFGNQHARAQENPLYGTTRVLRAGEVVRVAGPDRDSWDRALQRALDWLIAVQNPDGGWGGDRGLPSSIEESALAVEALAGFMKGEDFNVARISKAIGRGVDWLAEHTDEGNRFDTTPIGLYFAKLWYFEELYPLIFTVSALQRVRHLCGEGES